MFYFLFLISDTMPVMSMADKTYALRVRLQHSRAMYSGDYTRYADSNNPKSCGDATCNRGAALWTTPRVQYGTRLLDVQLGQLVCCQASGVAQTVCTSCASGCTNGKNLPSLD